jgi:tRNA-dihydrouridine synthase
MVGRALFGNPWFLHDEIKVFNNQFVETILKHIELATNFYGDSHAYKLMKKHLIYYVKGAKMPSSLKVPFYDAITRSNSADEQRSIINDTLKKVLAKNE